MIADRVEEIIEKFPRSTFLKQHGEPNYDKIKTIHKLVATYAASLEKTRGRGRHGYLAIVMLSDAVYHTLTGGTFITPTNAGPTPIIEGAHHQKK